MAEQATFKVGDRVERPENVFHSGSRVLHGTVVRVYGERSSLGHWDPELYEVIWDEKEGVWGGFLPHGLSPERRFT